MVDESAELGALHVRLTPILCPLQFSSRCPVLALLLPVLCRFLLLPLRFALLLRLLLPSLLLALLRLALRFFCCRSMSRRFPARLLLLLRLSVRALRWPVTFPLQGLAYACLG